MLRILGSPKQLCNGVTRRDWLAAGSLGVLGLSLPDVLRLQQAQAAPGNPPAASFGKAKNVILLYLFGGPSQLETFDFKPDAPAEVRGAFQPIASALPGCDVCEFLPHVAQVMDRVTVVRSLTHPWNFHGMQWATTGLPEGTIPFEETQRIPQHWPFLGSMYAYLDEQRNGPKARGSVPDNIILPFPLSSRRPAAMYARPHGAFLGSQYDPIFTEFRGEATRSMVRRSFGPPAEIFDPYLGVKPGCRFEIAPEAQLPEDITLDRIDGRRSLLAQLEEARRAREGAARQRPASVQLMDQHQQLAFSLLDSAAIRQALDLDQETPAQREAYGMTLFGQGALQARRLVEAGSRFVTVIWDEFGQLNAGWDTHVDHYNRMKHDLLPGFDLAFSALIRDLEDRGMLDDTLVLVMNEMGRTPRLEGDGRGHWGRAYCNLFAGAGIRRGNIVGRTDKIGGTVEERPASAKDVLATLYHLLGVDPHTMVRDRLDRPMPLVPYGGVIGEMVG
ncbi:MAG: DUF1501 domain-containing protein [Pirellulales bacterium]